MKERKKAVKGKKMCKYVSTSLKIQLKTTFWKI